MFSSFFPLDELFQIIYQGFYKFVLSTKTKHDAWAVHVAMIDDDATIFWYGSWDADTVAKQTGQDQPSSDLLDALVRTLEQAIVSGELAVNSDSQFLDKDEKHIRLVLGASSPNAPQMTLTRMAASDALTFAGEMMINLAMQAQSKRFTPQSSETYLRDSAAPLKRSTVGASGSSHRSSRDGSKSTVDTKEEQPRTKKVSASSTSSHRSLEKGKTKSSTVPESPTKAKSSSSSRQVQKQESSARKRSPSSSPPPTKVSKKPKAIAAPPKGASLANPSQRARKYKPLEFGSDSD
ncbi:hypothetical protein BDV98DRAFT_654271 [Pterulicium gracile]|uniref:Uncharacterized protein n=1 Tax=Pterulicium gracile TaxID=1884261 RepID=A0A5C3QTV6_9AGAR|nr:hypothetical protein BDV98DRAFT_654271 [Pterula gracilis]